MKIYVCEKCGSRDCQSSMWVELNTQKVLDENGDAIWCPTCEVHGVSVKEITITDLKFGVFDSDGNNTDIGTWKTVEDAIEHATDLVLNYWPADHAEAATVCSYRDGVEGATKLVTVERANGKGRSKGKARVRIVFVKDGVS